MFDDQFEPQDWRPVPTGVPIGHIAIVCAGDHDDQIFVWDGTQWVLLRHDDSSQLFIWDGTQWLLRE